MNIDTFMTGISRLKTFYPTFKPKDELVEEWFRLLKNFSNEAVVEAVNRLIETCETSPTYIKLKSELRTAERRHGAGKGFIVIVSGAVPRTDESIALSKKYMIAIENLLKEKDPSQEKIKELKRRWREEYPKLPGYKSREEVVRLAMQKRFDELYLLGVVEGDYTIGSRYNSFLGIRDEEYNSSFPQQANKLITAEDLDI
jgi:hypothetical protein